MKILSCYIENFGTFSKVNMEFEEGLNNIYRENGWGKTTLAAFLKAMLYGIEYNRSAENERKKYLPWNEGKYGGNLCFEAKGKRYRVERSFGKTDKSDTFALFDMTTNVVSYDYTEKLGEELFAVDRESFEKSVYVQVDDREETLLTDIMASKMSDIVQQDGDLDRLNETLGALEKRAAAIRAKRGNGGTLGVLKEQLSEEKRRLSECVDAQEKLEAEAARIKEYERKDALAKENLEYTNEQIMMYQYSDRRNEYERLKNEVKRCREIAARQNTFFKDTVPSPKEIENMQEHISEYNVQAALSKENAVTAEDKEKFNLYKSMFQNGIPTEEQFDGMSNEIRLLESAKLKSQSSIVDTNDIIRFEQLKERFAKEELTDRQIDSVIEKYEQIANLEKHREVLLNKRKEKEEKQRKDTQKYNSVMLSMFVIAGVIVLVGLVCLLIVDKYLGIGLEIGGIVTAAVGYFIIKPIPKQDAAIGMLEDSKAREISADIEKFTLAYTGFIREYGRKDGETSPIKAFAQIRADRDAYLELKKKITQMNEEHSAAVRETSDIKQHVDSFFEVYCADMTGGDYSEKLAELRESVRDYQRIRKVVGNHNQAVKAALKYKNIIYRFLEQYFAEVTRPAEQLRTVERNADEFRRVAAELSISQRELEAFCAENDTGKLVAAEKPKQSLEELGEQQRRFTEEITELSAGLAQAKKECDKYGQIADKRTDIESSIENLSEKIAEQEKEYEILNLTGELLKKSGEALSEKYISDIEAAFQKYMKRLGDERTRFCVDTALNVRMDKEGSLHDRKYFSAGQRDLTELCVRLALLDAVYKDGEKPVVIMDDPFVNFDDAALSKAKELLMFLSTQYQIIYFACQEGRIR